jgi:hypothetical protein
MKSLGILVTMALTVICRSETEPDPKAELSDSAPAENPRPFGPVWRRASLSGLHFESAHQGGDDGRSKVTAPAPPGSTQLADLDLVVLESMVINDRRGPDFREMEKIIRTEEQNGRSEAVKGKLGIATHVFKFKNVLFGYNTLFFIPISFGAAW